MATFDRNKYREAFEKRYGSGAYESGLSNAREIGRLQVQAEKAKADYSARLKAAEKAARESQKSQIFDGYAPNAEAESQLQSIIENPKKDGAYRNAEKIENDPSLQSAIKARGWTVNEFIDAMYNAASGGQFKSQRDFNSFNTQLKKDTKAANKAADEKQKAINGLTVKENYEYEKDKKKREAERLKEQREKEEKKKNQVGIFADIGRASKNFLQAVNPFDDVSFKDAFRNNVDDALTTERSKTTKELTRGLTRTANTGTLGLLDEAYKRTNDGQRASQFTNENRSTAGKVADFGYDMAGYLLPGLGAANALRGTKLGADLSKTGFQKALQLGKEGAVTGLGMGIAEVGIREGLNPQDYSAKDNLTHIGISTGAGLIGDPALYGAGKLANKGLEAGLRKALPQVGGDLPKFSGQVSDELVSRLPHSPVPKPTTPARFNNLVPDNYNMPNGQNVRMNRADIDSALQRTTSQLERIKPTVEDYNREFQEAVKQQYEYLKNSMGKGVDTGTTSNGLQGNFREVTGRYTVSKNPQWYQDFYAQTGRQPNERELWQLAERHVREGFADEVGTLPAWKPSAVQELDDQIDELVDILRQDPSQEPAIRPILEALEQDRNSLTKTIDDSVSQYSTLENQLNTFQQASRQPDIQPLPTREGAYRDQLSHLPTQQDALQNNVQPLRAGRDFEPIEQAPKNVQPVRVADDLLNTEKQAQGNASSFREKIDRKPKKEKGLLSGLRTQFMDDLAPLEQVEKEIAGKVGSAENSLYKQGRLFKGSAEKAHLIVQEQLSPVLNQVRKSGYSMEDLGDYALAVHAKDVNAQGINSGFTNAEIEDVIQKLGTPELEAARQELMKVNNHVLDILSTGDAPVLDVADVQAMREKWPNYMSLFRSFDDDKVEFASEISKTLSVGSVPIHRLKGSNRNVIDPLESMVKNIFKAVNTADRNNVAAQLGRLAKNEKAEGLIRQLANGEDKGRLNVISMMDKGEKVYYEVPPEVYKAMKNLDKESTNTLIKILQKPAGTLRAGATLTPEFSLRNPMRDIPQAFVVSESGFNPATDFPVGLWQTMWKGRKIKIGNKEFAPSSGELYKQFIKENGGYGNIVSMDRDLHRQTLQKILSEPSTEYIDVLDPQMYKSLLKNLANPIKTLRNIADASETATKLGEFRAATRSGASPQEAAYRARDIMDYARAGVSIREANKVVAFLNANMQGKSKLWRAFQKNPSKVAGKAVAAVTLPTIAALYAQETLSNDRQREILDDAPQWLKDTFYLIPVPGTDQIARIPKPFDLAYPFSNTLERAWAWGKYKDEEAFDGFVKESLSASALPVMLTGLAPIVEGMANYSFFRQGPVIPQREQNLEYPDQYDINTTELAKGIGKGVHQLTGGQGAFKNFGSPRVIDNTIQGFTGGLGTYATSIIDLFIDSEEGEKPAKSIDQQPLARAFLVNQSSGGKSLDKLYSERSQLTKERGSAQQNQEPFPKEPQYKYLNNVAKTISEINKQIRTIENSKDYSAQEKRERLDPLIQQRNELARQTMERYQQMK